MEFHQSGSPGSLSVIPIDLTADAPAGQLRCPVVGCPQSSEGFLSEYILLVHMKMFHEYPNNHSLEQQTRRDLGLANAQQAWRQQEAHAMGLRQANAVSNTNSGHQQLISWEQQQSPNPQVYQHAQNQVYGQYQLQTSYQLQNTKEYQHQSAQNFLMQQSPVSNHATSQHPSQIAYNQQQWASTRNIATPQQQKPTPQTSQNLQTPRYAVQAVPSPQHWRPNGLGITVPHPPTPNQSRSASLSGISSTTNFALDTTSGTAKLISSVPQSPAFSPSVKLSNGSLTPMPSPQTAFQPQAIPHVAVNRTEQQNPFLQWPHQFQTILKSIMIKHGFFEPTNGESELERKMHYIYGDFQAEAGSMILGDGKAAKLDSLAKAFPSMASYTQVQMIKAGELSRSYGGSVPATRQALSHSPPTTHNLTAKVMPKSEAIRIWKTLDMEEQSQLFWDQIRVAKDQSRLMSEVLGYYKNVCNVKENQDSQAEEQSNSANVKATQPSANIAPTTIASTILTDQPQKEECYIIDQVHNAASRTLQKAYKIPVAIQPIQRTKTQATTGDLVMSPPVTPAPTEKPQEKPPSPKAQTTEMLESKTVDVPESAEAQASEEPENFKLPRRSLFKLQMQAALEKQKKARSEKRESDLEIEASNAKRLKEG